MKVLYLFKKVISTGLIVVCTVAAFYFVVDDIVEKNNLYVVNQKMEAIKTYLDEQKAGFTEISRTWAAKQSIVSFLKKNTLKNRKKIQKTSDYKKDNIEHIALINTLGDIQFSKSFNANNNKFSKLDQKIKFRLEQKQLQEKFSGKNVIAGYINAKGLVLMSIAPVFLEDEESVIGYLVLGRKLPVSAIEKDNASSVLVDEINLALYPSQSHLLSAFEKNTFYHQRNQKELKSSFLIRGINDKPASVVSIIRPVQKLEKLMRISWLSMLVLLGLSLLLGYIFWWNKKVRLEADIQRLSKDIQNVRVGTELSGRLSNDNRNIFSSVVTSINQKIGGFEKSIDDIHSISRRHDAEIVLNELPLEAYLKDIDLKYITVNQKYCDSLGIGSEDIIGKTDEQLNSAENVGTIREKEEQVISGKEPVIFEETIGNDIRGERFYSTHLIPFINDKGRVEGVVGVRIDITVHRQAEAEMEMASKVLENTAEGVMVTDALCRVIHVNSSYSEMTGYDEKDLLGKVPLLLQKESKSKVYQEIQRQLESKGSWRGELWSSRKNGSSYPEMINIKAIRNKDGEITNYFSMSIDITDQKEWEEQLYKMAHYDSLTGLPNRTLFKDRLKQEISRSQRNNKHIGVLFLDLDLFKSINDSLGHAAGDELLKVVGERLKTTLRNTDSIARLGGDEFTIMVTDLSPDYDKNIGYLTHLSETIIGVINQPMDINGREINATCSVGVTVFPVDAQNVEDLLRNADSAMYYAKSQGRRNYQFYSKEFNEQAVDRLEKEIEFRSALKAGALEIYFQPQVDVISRHVVGAEALLRWKKDGENILGPEKIISLAEETGLIYELGNWILKHACIEGKKWQQMGHKNIRVAVNLSTRQFRQKNLVEIVSSILEETGLPAKLLELEVTESSLMENIEYSIGMMSELSRMGIRWSLDDFGTGYSSLNYLRDFPVHVLKVDQSFVRGITINPEDSAIVETIIDLAHRLHLTVIAEGVENEEQLKALSRMNCEQVQGYYFSRPMSSSNFIEYVSDGVKV